MSASYNYDSDDELRLCNSSTFEGDERIRVLNSIQSSIHRDATLENYFPEMKLERIKRNKTTKTDSQHTEEKYEKNDIEESYIKECNNKVKIKKNRKSLNALVNALNVKKYGNIFCEEEMKGPPSTENVMKSNSEKFSKLEAIKSWLDEVPLVCVDGVDTEKQIEACGIDSTEISRSASQSTDFATASTTSSQYFDCLSSDSFSPERNVDEKSIAFVKNKNLKSKSLAVSERSVEDKYSYVPDIRISSNFEYRSEECPQL